MVHHATNIMARWRPLCNRHFIVSGESGESPGEASGKRGRGSRARERRSPGRSLQKPRRSYPPAPRPVAGPLLPLFRWPAPFAASLNCSLPAPGRVFAGAARNGVVCSRSFHPACTQGAGSGLFLQENGAFRAMVPGLLGDIPSAVSRSVGKTPGHEWLDYPLRRFRPPKPPRS